MDKPKKMGYFRFITEHIFWGTVFWVLYINTVFRPVKGTTPFHSQFILLHILVLFSLFSCVLRDDENKCLRVVMTDIVFSFGIYTAISYLSIAKVFVYIILILSFLPAAAYFVFLMTRKNKSSLKMIHVLYLRLRKTTGVAVGIFSAFFTVMISVFFIISFPSVISEIYSPWGTEVLSFEDSAEKNISELSCFSEDIWNSRTKEEKLRLLRVVVDIESETLGLEEVPELKEGKMKEKKLGYYEGADRAIYLNMDTLEKYNPWISVNTVCHEMYHAYEHQLVDLYISTERKYRKLEVMQKINTYLREFSEYNPAEDDYGKYYNQQCEEDAREYASVQTVRYYSFVYNNMKKE